MNGSPSFRSTPPPRRHKKGRIVPLEVNDDRFCVAARIILDLDRSQNTRNLRKSLDLLLLSR